MNALFLVALPLLGATPAETHFLETISKDALPEVRALLKSDPGLATRARTQRGNSALVVASQILSDGEFFYPPAKNQVLQEVLKVAPPADAYEACLVGDLARARAFLEREPRAARELERNGWTLLHAAAYSGNLELVKLLLAQGAVVDAVAKTHFTNTPLQTAMLTGQGEVARALVQAGADVNHRQVEGFTVLHDAAARGDLPLVRFFLAHGADPKARSIHNDTTVSVARSHGHPEVAAVLEALQ